MPHLRIALADYDRQIRTFIPNYDEMLDVVSDTVPRARCIIVSIGTGALAARCESRLPRAKLIGIDADPSILARPAKRLGRAATLIDGDFLRVPLPPTDAVVTSFSPHHVRTAAAKRRLYRRIAAAIRPRGVFVTADCSPSSVEPVALAQRQAWRAHVQRTFIFQSTPNSPC